MAHLAFFDSRQLDVAGPEALHPHQAAKVEALRRFWPPLQWVLPPSRPIALTD
jgi:hypothetical protein